MKARPARECESFIKKGKECVANIVAEKESIGRKQPREQSKGGWSDTTISL
jgi:hypothetical protein